MTTLLHVCASPRRENSDSLRVANEFLKAYYETNPDVKNDSLDLFDGNLPTFGRLAAEAKLARLNSRTATDEQEAEWLSAHKLFQRFATADRYLFNIPMWNNGIPYVLKQWIDIINQPGWTFGIDQDGYHPLMKDKKVAVVYTSGTFAQGRGPAFGNDFQSTYFVDWLNLIGISDISDTRLQPTILSPTYEAQKAASMNWARDAAASF
jgi:FMN-dependent NADH-azoreductase